MCSTSHGSTEYDSDVDDRGGHPFDWFVLLGLLPAHARETGRRRLVPPNENECTAPKDHYFSRAAPPYHDDYTTTTRRRSNYSCPPTLTTIVGTTTTLLNAANPYGFLLLLIPREKRLDPVVPKKTQHKFLIS